MAVGPGGEFVIDFIAAFLIECQHIVVVIEVGGEGNAAEAGLCGFLFVSSKEAFACSHAFGLWQDGDGEQLGVVAIICGVGALVEVAGQAQQGGRTCKNKPDGLHAKQPPSVYQDFGVVSAFGFAAGAKAQDVVVFIYCTNSNGQP